MNTKIKAAALTLAIAMITSGCGLKTAEEAKTDGGTKTDTAVVTQTPASGSSSGSDTAAEGSSTASDTTAPVTSDTTTAESTTAENARFNEYYAKLSASDKDNSIFAEVFEGGDDIPVQDTYEDEAGYFTYKIVPKLNGSTVEIYAVKSDAEGLPAGPDMEKQLYSAKIEDNSSVKIRAYGDETVPHFVVIVTDPDGKKAMSYSHSDGRGYFDPVYLYNEKTADGI